MFSRETKPLGWFRGRKVTVMGLGLFGGGRGVTEFLCRRGAQVTVTDLRGTGELAPTLEDMTDLPVRWVLGEHKEADFLEADLVVANPAVPRTAPLLELCCRRGVPLETETNLFFKYAHGRICAVTGSNGKTTTTRLVEAMARRRWKDVRAGGNLGHSLLPDVESIRDRDWVILELSSFQLEDLRAVDRRPEISLVCNLSPNHLDRHGTYDAYVEAKREIVAPGPPPDIGVFSYDDALLREWAEESSRTAVFFGFTDDDGAARTRGVWIDEASGEVFFSEGPDDAARHFLFRTADLNLRGQFNLLNAAGAAAAATTMGVGADEIRAAVRDFRPVEHRLELFLEDDGVEYFDDSIATTPESTIAALEALGPEVLLICGGSSKGCSLEKLAEAIASQAKVVFLIGTTAPDIDRALRAVPPSLIPSIHHAGTLEVAAAEARNLATPGDRVVLSPSFPSYDQFVNFEARGRRFKELVREAGGSSP